ncbi:MAG: hypothetical protein LBH38_03665 [Holosporales bacterium]|nr:hypothetical protein [Holosporales bacterium]
MAIPRGMLSAANIYRYGISEITSYQGWSMRSPLSRILSGNNDLEKELISPFREFSVVAETGETILQ